MQHRTQGQQIFNFWADKLKLTVDFGFAQRGSLFYIE